MYRYEARHNPKTPNEYMEDRHGYDSFFSFDSTRSQKVFILTQLITHNGFQGLIQIRGAESEPEPES